MVFIGSATTPGKFSELKDGIQVKGDDITDGNSNVIFDQSNNYIPLSILQNDSITISSGNGLKGGSSVTLGSSNTINADIGDLSGKYLSSDGNASPSITVNLGNGLNEGATAGNVSVDESYAFDFSSDITFSSGLTLGDTVDASTNIIENLPSPSAASDAARKGYVDSVAQGLDVKESCRVATDGTNIDLTSGSINTTIDGITVSSGDNVLLKDQTDAKQNGIYVVGSTASDATTWSRSEDFNDDADVTSGSFTFVQEGNANDGISFAVISSDPISVATDPVNDSGDNIVFDQFTTAGEIVAGTGLSKSSRTLSINLSDFINSSKGIKVNTNDNLEAKTDSSLELDGTGNLSINTGNSNSFSASQTFSGGFTVEADITNSDGSTVYNSTNKYVPESILETLSNSALTNSSLSISVTDGGGLSFTDSSHSDSISLGNTSTDLEVSPGDFIDTSQLSINGSGNISIDDIFLQNSGDTISGSLTFQDFFELEPVTAPTSPSTGNTRIYVDSSDNNVKAKASDGSVATLINT